MNRLVGEAGEISVVSRSVALLPAIMRNRRGNSLDLTYKGGSFYALIQFFGLDDSDFNLSYSHQQWAK
jgi:hypothetical protein